MEAEETEAQLDELLAERGGRAVAGRARLGIVVQLIEMGGLGLFQAALSPLEEASDEAEAEGKIGEGLVLFEERGEELGEILDDARAMGLGGGDEGLSALVSIGDLFGWHARSLLDERGRS